VKINFLEVSLEGFRSFVEPTTFHLDRAPGLYFIRGQNDLEPDLAGNGVGKSTLFEGVFWCLFGKTTNGVSAANISTWGSDKASVTVTISIDGVVMTITRSRGPNRLTINGKEVTQDRVVAELGLTPDLVASAILIGQFSPTFVEKGHAERLEMFSQMLDLQRWDTYSDTAKQQAADIAKHIGDDKTNLSFLQGKREGIDIESVRKLADGWKEVRTARANVQRSTVKLAERALDQAKDKLEEASAESVVLRAMAAPGVIKLPERPQPVVDPDMVEWERQQEEFRQTLWKISEKVRIANAQIKNISALGAVCSICFQPVGPEHKHSQLTDLNDALAIYETDRQLATKASNEIKRKIEARTAVNTANYLQAVAEWQQQCQQIDVEWRAAQDQYTNYLAARALTIRKLDGAKVGVLNATANLNNAKKQLNAIEAETNPHLMYISSLEEQAVEYDIKIKFLEDEIIKQQKLHHELDYWIGGFKKIRLLIIEEALTALEMAVNDAMVQLGLRGWTINLQAERELTTGAFKREFTILVQSPYNDELVPWDVWSGGERQRLRLALIFGLQTFMQQRRGVSVNLLFLDEPSNWLSESGVTDMLSFLKEKAQRDNLCIWLADHRTLDAGDFTKTFLIRKTETGSHIEGD